MISKTVIEHFKLPIALSLIGLVLIIGGIVASGLTTQKPRDYPKESIVQSKSQKQISVDVSGAVNKPGVYKLNEGDRIQEAIKAAGGFSATANQEYIAKSLNLAQKLSDGGKIYVPAVGETGSVTQPAGGNTQSKVNINSATQSELEALPGIGPVTASKIISDRPYQDIQELLTKKEVSKAVYEKIKDSLVTY